MSSSNVIFSKKIYWILEKAFRFWKGIDFAQTWKRKFSLLLVFPFCLFFFFVYFWFYFYIFLFCFFKGVYLRTHELNCDLNNGGSLKWGLQPGAWISENSIDTKLASMGMKNNKQLHHISLYLYQPLTTLLGKEILVRQSDPL